MFTKLPSRFTLYFGVIVETGQLPAAKAPKMLTKFLAGQLACPHGLFGRWIMPRRLNRFNAEMNDLTFEVLAPSVDQRILEIGFGGGDLVDRLVSAGAIVVGADLSGEAVSYVSRRLRDSINNGRAELCLADVVDLPFPDLHFSKACSVNTLYFWEDVGRALQELRRVLQPAGDLVICFNPAHELEKWSGHKYGFKLFSEEDLVHGLRKAGFHDVRTSKRQDAVQGEIVCMSAKRC